MILGFDTSAAHCAAALLSGDKVLAAAHQDMARGQAEALVPMLEHVLREAGAQWRDLDALGVGLGPGNFTGVRIAVATARGMALALNIPAIGISIFEARAAGLPRPLTVVEDARRGDVYLQHFRPDPTPPCLCAADDADSAPGFPVTGSAAAVWAARCGGDILPARYPLAEAIARAARAELATGRQLPRPAPLYIRPADAAPSRDAQPAILP